MTRSELAFRVAGLAGSLVVRALFATVRLRVDGGETVDALTREGRPFILVLWHGQMLAPIYLHRGQEITVLVSEHADGEYVTRVLQRFGHRTVRGSSTRGGTRGLRDLLRVARGGGRLAVTPDGPRGPRHVFKVGALLPARIHGIPVIPIGVAASRARVLGSWDRFLLPQPFSTVWVAYGDPVQVPRDADDATMEGIAGALGQEMQRLTARCEARLGAGGEGGG